MKVDKNDIYGTYARGEGGEGDYGDGDKVYVEDSNPEYSNVYYGSWLNMNKKGSFYFFMLATLILPPFPPKNARWGATFHTW